MLSSLPEQAKAEDGRTANGIGIVTTPASVGAWMRAGAVAAALALLASRTATMRPWRRVRWVPATSPGEVVALTVSMGVATLEPGQSMDAVGLLAAADGALYGAQAMGRNRVCVAEPPSAGSSSSAPAPLALLERKVEVRR